MTTRLNDLEERIHIHYASKAAQEPRRGYLGVSSLSDSCLRKLFLSFRRAFNVSLEARIYRLFDTGKREEERLVEDLKNIGVHIGHRQDTLVPLRHPHIRGHCDGAASVDGQLCVFEFKTSNARQFSLLEGNGVHKTKPEHVDQLVCYMELLDQQLAASIDPQSNDRPVQAPFGMYVAVCKDNDRIYTEKVLKDSARANKLFAKGQSVIDSPDVPEGLLAPTVPPCKWCEYSGFCFGANKENSLKALEMNCRTCLHSTPEKDGSWSCALKQEEISTQKGCPKHLFLPGLVNATTIGGSEDAVQYSSSLGVLTNVAGGEIRKADMSIVRGSNFDSKRTTGTS